MTVSTTSPHKTPRRSIPVTIANTPNTRNHKWAKIRRTFVQAPPVRSLLKLPKWAIVIVGGTFLLTLGALIYLFIIKPVFTTTKQAVENSISAVQNDPASTQPQYKTLTPDGAGIEKYGGWTRVSPADKNPVFAYVDSIGDVRITVSQQPLPEDFKNDTQVQMEQLALGYKANEKITVDDSIAYIGTSAKGPQSVIVSRGDLLILIKSTAKLSNDQWAHYIHLLQ